MVDGFCVQCGLLGGGGGGWIFDEFLGRRSGVREGG